MTPTTPEQRQEAIHEAAAAWGLSPLDFQPLAGTARVWMTMKGMEKLLEQETDPDERALIQGVIDRRKARFQENLDAMATQRPTRQPFPWRAIVCGLLLLATGFVAGWRLHEAGNTVKARESFEAGLKVGAICAHHPEELACKRESLETGGVL